MARFIFYSVSIGALTSVILASCTVVPRARFQVESLFSGKTCEVKVFHAGAMIYSFSGLGSLGPSGDCANCEAGSFGNGLQLQCSENGVAGGLELYIIRGDTLTPIASEVVGRELPINSRTGRRVLNSVDQSLSIPKFRKCGWMLTGVAGTLKISAVSAKVSDLIAESKTIAELTVGDGVASLGAGSSEDCPFN